MKILFILTLAFLCLGSCRSIRSVSVESVRHDSIYITARQHDSIYMRDSIYVRDKGDTVFIYKDKYIYAYLGKTDTMYRNRTDTITQFLKVERELTGWQKLRMNVGGWCMGILLILILCGIWRIIKH